MSKSVLQILFKIILLITVQILFTIFSIQISKQLKPEYLPHPNNIKNGITNVSITSSIALFLVFLNIIIRNFKFNLTQIYYFFLFLFINVILVFFYQPKFLTNHYPIFKFFLSFGILLNFVLYSLLYLVILYKASFDKISDKILYYNMDKVVVNFPLGLIILFIIAFPLVSYSDLGESRNIFYPNFGEGRAASNYLISGLLSTYLLLRINNIILETSQNPDSGLITVYYLFENLNTKSIITLITEFIIALICLLGSFTLTGIVTSDSFLIADYSVPKKFITFVLISAIPSSLFFASNIQSTKSKQ